MKPLVKNVIKYCPLIFVTFLWGQKRCDYSSKSLTVSVTFLVMYDNFGIRKLSQWRYRINSIDSSIRIGHFYNYNKFIFWLKVSAKGCDYLGRYEYLWCDYYEWGQHGHFWKLRYRQEALKSIEKEFSWKRHIRLNLD